MPKTILVLSSKEDCLTIRSILDDREYNVVMAHNLNEAKELASQQLPSVIICEACTPDGNDWKKVFESMIQGDETQSSFVVCSKQANESLWNELLKLGHRHDVLNKPFRQDEVRWVVRSAADFVARQAQA